MCEMADVNCYGVNAHGGWVYILLTMWSTRVDDDNIGVLWLLHNAQAVALQIAKHHLRIDGVLRTAERDQRHAMLFCGCGPQPQHEVSPARVQP